MMAFYPTTAAASRLSASAIFSGAVRCASSVLGILRALAFACGLLTLLGGAVSAQAERHSGLVDVDERTFVIDQVLGKLRASYVNEEIADQMAAAIRAHQAAGDYDPLTRAVAFVEVLTRDLRAVSGDKHVTVEFFAEPITTTAPSPPPDTGTPPLPMDAGTRHPANRPNSQACRFVNVAVLAGSVGYVKFDAFVSPQVCAETAAAAMSLVADCDALIFDLRDNAGGDPAMVAFMSSYLFTEPRHLSDIYDRRTRVTFESWTVPFVPGRRFIGKPVFILTSPRTFSAAEEFAYDLQVLKRAVVVGETSGGAAHPAVSLPIGGHFQVAVPIGRYVNPISRTNWEGAGVEPDVRARENVAVQAAYRAALQDVLRRLTPSSQREAMQRQIDVLTTAIEAER
jgi:hypothetical protein